MAAKCSLCGGCDDCEGRGVAWGVIWGGFIGAVAAGAVCMMLFRPGPGEYNRCEKSCETVGHSEHAFDVQRGCVCSDPYPEVPEPTRKWVRP